MAWGIRHVRRSASVSRILRIARLGVGVERAQPDLAHEMIISSRKHAGTSPSPTHSEEDADLNTGGRFDTAQPPQQAGQTIRNALTLSPPLAACKTLPGCLVAADHPLALHSATKRPPGPTQ